MSTEAQRAVHALLDGVDRLEREVKLLRGNLKEHEYKLNLQAAREALSSGVSNLRGKSADAYSVRLEVILRRILAASFPESTEYGEAMLEALDEAREAIKS